jgi:hypothetical protein
MIRPLLCLALAAAMAVAPARAQAEAASPAAEALAPEAAGEGGAEAAAEAAADRVPAPAETPAAETPAAEAPAATPAAESPAPEASAADPQSERDAVVNAPDSTPATPAPEAVAASPSPSPSAAAAPEPLPADVPEKHWAAGAVRRSLKRGMLELHGGKFAGAQTATRRDLAMVVGGILTAAGKTGPSTPAKDLEKNDPAAKSIALAAGSGALKLHKGNRLSGNQPITREDLARSMSRLLAVVRNENEGPVSDPVELNDLPPDSNLFNPVQRVLKAKIISLINLKYEGYLPVPRFALASVASKVLDAIKK